MLETLFALAVFLLAFLGMALGSLIGKHGISGSCGGLNQIPGVTADCGGACRRGGAGCRRQQGQAAEDDVR